MKNKEVIKLDKIINQTTSQPGCGTQLELLAADKHGDEIDIDTYPLCRFISEENEVLFEIYVQDKIIRFPITELENAIKLAKTRVSSEESFGN